MAPQHSLTPRESEVLGWLAKGLSNRDIADVLGVAPKTVEFHLTNVYAKLGVRNRTQAVVRGIARELIPMRGAHRDTGR